MMMIVQILYSNYTTLSFLWCGAFDTGSRSFTFYVGKNGLGVRLLTFSY